MNKPKLILIRGIPGSGKSTFAELLYRLNPTFKHFEADMYFMKGDQYKFNAKDIAKAHEWCYHSTNRALRNGFSVIVSNTFTQKWEMERYLKLPYTKTVFHCTGLYNNVHNVPDYVIKKMLERWENFDGEITV